MSEEIFQPFHDEIQQNMNFENEMLSPSNEESIKDADHSFQRSFLTPSPPFPLPPPYSSDENSLPPQFPSRRSESLLVQSTPSSSKNHSYIAKTKCPKSIPDFCSICLESKSVGALSAVQCGHVFHSSCIQSWMKTKAGTVTPCPECNQPSLQVIPLFLNFYSPESAVTIDEASLVSSNSKLKSKIQRYKNRILRYSMLIKKLQRFSRAQRETIRELRQERDTWRRKYFQISASLHGT